MFVQPSIKISGQDLSWRWDRGAGRDGYGAASWGQGHLVGSRDQKGWGALEVSNAQNSHKYI